MEDNQPTRPDASEQLLDAWLRMSLCIRGNRILNETTFNEAAICHLLRNADCSGMTASQLCGYTKLQKSQMNRELNGLESRGLIRRSADPKDKRKTLIWLTDEGDALYCQEHDRVLNIFGNITDELGNREAAMLASALSIATNVAEKTIREEF